MATANLTWSPVGGVFSVSQDVEFKAMGDVGWTLHSNVSASTSAATITGLLDNVIYQFRITNHCPSALTGLSTVVEGTHLTCPTLSVDPSSDSVDYSFVDLGGDISMYFVELLNASDVVLDSYVFSSPSGTISGTFSGLSPSTSYQMRVTVSAAGSAGTFFIVCAPVTIATIAAVCNAPTGVSAVMS
jgi:hypothetical protein